MDCCCICTEDYFNGKNIASLYCGHVFHQDCIKQWLRSSNQSLCPHCRMPINGYIPKLYLDINDSLSESHVCSIQEQLIVENSILKHDLDEERENTRLLREQLEYRIRVLEKGAHENAQRHQDVEKEKIVIQEENKALKLEIKLFKEANESHLNEKKRLKADIESLKKKLFDADDAQNKLKHKYNELLKFKQESISISNVSKRSQNKVNKPFKFIYLLK